MYNNREQCEHWNYVDRGPKYEWAKKSHGGAFYGCLGCGYFYIGGASASAIGICNKPEESGHKNRLY